MATVLFEMLRRRRRESEAVQEPPKSRLPREITRQLQIMRHAATEQQVRDAGTRLEQLGDPRALRSLADIHRSDPHRVKETVYPLEDRGTEWGETIEEIQVYWVRDIAKRTIDGLLAEAAATDARLLLEALADAEEHGERHQWPASALETVLVDRARQSIQPLDSMLRKEHVGAEIIASAFAHARNVEAVPVLIGALTSRDTSVRREAAAALGSLGDTASVAPLTAMLQYEKAPSVRRSVALALGLLQSSAATETLVSLLEDEDPGVVWNSIDALAEIGDPGAAGALVQFVSATSPEGGAPDSETRRRAVLAIGRFGATGHVDVLAGVLEDPSPEVRQEAARVLGMSNDVSAVPLLIPALSDLYPKVREAAVEALDRIGGETARAALRGYERGPHR